jgi:hypothetical protein
MLQALLILCAAVFFSSCSSSDDYGDSPSQPPPVATDAKFAAVQPTIARACGRCHDGVKQKPKFDTPAKFKTAKVLQMIESGAMPPGGKIEGDDKDALVAYLRG